VPAPAKPYGVSNRERSNPRQRRRGNRTRRGPARQGRSSRGPDAATARPGPPGDGRPAARRVAASPVARKARDMARAAADTARNVAADAGITPPPFPSGDGSSRAASEGMLTSPADRDCGRAEAGRTTRKSAESGVPPQSSALPRVPSRATLEVYLRRGENGTWPRRRTGGGAAAWSGRHAERRERPLPRLGEGKALPKPVPQGPASAGVLPLRRAEPARREGLARQRLAKRCLISLVPAGKAACGAARRAAPARASGGNRPRWAGEALPKGAGRASP
jgi:hypothetical protein